MTREWYPSLNKPRQKLLRYLEPHGEIPAWSTKALVKRRLITPWRKRPTVKPSCYKRQMMEHHRVKYHYNVKNSQMKVYMKRAFRKGVESPVVNFLQQLESRLDNVVWRCGLAPTMASARRFCVQGHMQHITGHGKREWRTVNVPSIRMKVGDRFRVNPRQPSLNSAKYNMDQEQMVEVPSNLKWDKAKLEGEYLDICDNEELGIDIEDKWIILWYSGQGRNLQPALRRTHIRYFEGSRNIIKKIYNGGRTRPTPENILNMKRGVGLMKRGRAKPPCLWGRRRPLNSAYEKGGSSR